MHASSSCLLGKQCSNKECGTLGHTTTSSTTTTGVFEATQLGDDTLSGVC